MAAYNGPVEVLPAEHDLYELTKNEDYLTEDPALVEQDQDIDLDAVVSSTVAPRQKN